MLSPLKRVLLAIVVLVLLQIPGELQAQNVGDYQVEITAHDIRFRHPFGYSEAHLGRGWLELGFPGYIRIYGTDAEVILFFDGESGDLTIGGGVEDGDIALRDTDGTTTTVRLHGDRGFLQLGSAGTEDGDIEIFDNNPAQRSFYVDGATGNVTNQLGGNGLVKAWARIAADGEVVSCWRCNESEDETGKISTGMYEVDFELGDISGRPVLGTLAYHSPQIYLSPPVQWFPSKGMIKVQPRSEDESSVYVGTFNSNGTAQDQSFDLLVF